MGHAKGKKHVGQPLNKSYLFKLIHMGVLDSRGVVQMETHDFKAWE